MDENVLGKYWPCLFFSNLAMLDLICQELGLKVWSLHLVNKIHAYLLVYYSYNTYIRLLEDHFICGKDSVGSSQGLTLTFYTTFRIGK